jgi:PAS domain-containing protein
LRKAGFDPSWAQVEDEQAFREALTHRDWDVVLADYSLPKYSAAEAIGHLREVQPYLPMIVVSGNVGEETAVSVVKAGAGDYVMKDSLARLAPAIDREIRDAQERRDRDQRKDRSQRLAAQAVHGAPVGILLVNSAGQVEFCNPKACKILEATEEEVVGAAVTDLVNYPCDGSSCDVEADLPGGKRVRLLCRQAASGSVCCMVEPAAGA